MKRREFIKGSAILGASVAIPFLAKGNSGLFEGSTGRKVFKILNTEKTMVGTLPVLRAFAGDHTDHVSPYVFFDEFGPVEVTPRSKPLRVDAHPHAGIIPITYFLAGSGHHKDSLNYDFQISKGDFMMFSSGKGAIHMEETGQKLYDEGGKYHGFQIWLNMPAKLKFSDPTTNIYKKEKMGKIEAKDHSAVVVLGEMLGTKSNIPLPFPAFYFHIKLKPNCKLEIPTDPTHNAFIYNINGTLEVEGRREIKPNQVVLYQRGESNISIFSKDGGEILLLGGKPFNEPVYSYGPFVMNTEAEINKVISDYQTGKMGDPKVVNGYSK